MCKIQSNILLNARHANEIILHAQTKPDEEVCGLIGAIDGRVKNIYRVENVANDPAENFLMAPEDQIKTMREMRNKKEALWGIYHSHPNTPARPSEKDLEMAAYPDTYYLIVSLSSDSPELKAYYYNGKNFEASSLGFSDASG